MKKLAVYLKEYKKETVLAPLFKLLEVVFDLLVPIVVANMIDIGVAGDDREYMIKSALLLLLMAAMGLASSVTAQFFAAKASVGFSAKLRKALFDHIQGLSFTELDTLGTDTLVTRLNDDVNQVQNGLNMSLRLVLRSPFVVLGAMALAFTIDTRCALIYTVAIPVLFAVVLAIMLVSIPMLRRVQSGLDKVTGLTRENLTGVRVIRAFCREEQSVSEFQKANSELTRLSLFVGRISALLNPLTYVLINLATVWVIHRGALSVNVGELQQGDVVALYNYMLQIIVELIKLASLIITLNKALACSGRVSAVLDVKSSMSSGSESAGLTDTAVEFKNVSFTYKGAGAPSLSDISFTAPKGSTIGIIGGTGSGKSTLISLIPRFYDATEGEILINGRDVKKYSSEYLCGAVGVVQQKGTLFRGSIRDNLLWGNEKATDEELLSALETAQAAEVVRSKPGGLDFMLEQNGRNLSGGQRQRISIARTLVKNPEILILDDSSSALDYATDAALRGAIRRLKNVTTFLVSQRIAVIRHADCILVLDNGTISGMGSHDELMKSCNTYREIYFSQFPEERDKYAV